jgi:ABC-type transport system involved in cytochrome c biogenesis permease subunit
MPLDRVSIYCFGASYAAALIVEVMQLLRPARMLRTLAALFGGAGLLAHSIYLGVQQPALASQFGSLLFLTWILAVFYLYGSLHHRRWAWGIFVLPIVLGLIVLAAAGERPAHEPASEWKTFILGGESFWRMLHVGLFVLAAVGVCVAFVASLMYLFQAHRLKAKVLPTQGLRLPSLERLESMNRRAINLAFPLLTIGLLVGLAQMLQAERLPAWNDPRVLSTVLLWFVFAVLLYLRYGRHLRGRNVALLTVMAFALLLLTFVSQHSLVPGGAP